MALPGIERPTALVTGAARRIGRAIATLLARRGYDVAIHYQASRGDALEAVGEVEALGARSMAFSADLAKFEDLEALIPAITHVLGHPSCLVNNASVFRHDTITTTIPDTWSAHLDVNLRAPVFLAQAMARNLPIGIDGNVINIIDQRILRLTPDFFSYTLSKAGLWVATQTMAQAFAPRIRVNAIAPGPTLRSVHQSDAEFAAECAATLLKRGSNPQEIAAAVGFILDAPALTGQLIALDGGQHLAQTPA